LQATDSGSSRRGGIEMALSIDQLYQQILGRAPDAGGAAYWGNLFGNDIDANEMASFRQAAAPEAYDNIYNSVSNGTMQYGDAIKAAAAAYDKPTNEYASTNNREMTNLAFAATGKEPWYNDTSTALGGFSGNPLQDATASWVGPKQSDFVNPYYTQGAGQDFVQQSEQAILPGIQAAGQAALAQQQAANSVPTGYAANPDGSTTASFVGGGTHSIAGPDSLSLLQGAYRQVPQVPQIGAPDPYTGSVPPAGGGLYGGTGSSGGYAGTAPTAGQNPFGGASMGPVDPATFSSVFSPVAASSMYGGGGAPQGSAPGMTGGARPAITGVFSDQTDFQGPNPYAQGGQGSYLSQNPYLSSMADDIGRRTQQNLGQAFNQIRSNSIGTGGYGGSRQGVAQGIATRGAMDSLQGNLAGLFGGQYNQDANRDLSRYQGDQQFYNGGRALDLQGAQIGGNLITQGVQGGWLPINQASSVFNTTAGNNVTNTNTAQQGGGWLGAAGGALGGAQLAKNVGWFGGSGTGGSQTGWW
jgi:hypothetical protein